MVGTGAAHQQDQETPTSITSAVQAIGRQRAAHQCSPGNHSTLHSVSRACPLRRQEHYQHPKLMQLTLQYRGHIWRLTCLMEVVHLPTVMHGVVPAGFRSHLKTGLPHAFAAPAHSTS